MLNGVKFFQFIPMNGGGTGSPDKIAIQLDAKADTPAPQNAESFLACLGDLLSMSEEEVKSSLNQLDWVPVGDNGEMLTAVLDLPSEVTEDGTPLENLLLSQMMALPPNETNPLQETVDPSPQSSDTGVESENVAPEARESANAKKSMTRWGLARIEGAPSQASQTATNASDNSLPQAPAGETKRSAEAVSVPEKPGPIEVAEAKVKAPVVQETSDPQTARQQKTPTDAMPTSKGNPTETVEIPNDKTEGQKERSGDAHVPIKPIEKTALKEAPDAQASTNTLPTGKHTEIDRNLEGRNQGKIIQPGRSEPQGNELRPVPNQNHQDQEAEPSPHRTASLKTPGNENPGLSNQNHAHDGEPETQGQHHRENHVTAPKIVESAGIERYESTLPSEKADSPASARTMQQDVFRQIVDRMALRKEGSQSQVSIKLKPEFLGNLKVQISTEHHNVVVRMTAESTAVKEMIENGLATLKAEFQQHGLTIDKFDVFVGQENESWRQRQQQTAARQNRRENGRKTGGLNKEDDGARDIGPLAAEASGNTRVNMNEVDFFA